MLPNPAVRIVLTKSRKFIDKFFMEDRDPKVSLSENERRGFIFSSESNKNFLELTHKMGENGKAIFSVTLIDPGGELEQELLDHFSAQRQFYGEPKENLEKITGVTLQGNLEKGKFTESKPKSLKLEDILKKEEVFYLAYGIGEDLGAWAGPFRVMLVGIEMTYTLDGIRSFLLNFAPQNSIYFNLTGYEQMYVDLRKFKYLGVRGEHMLELPKEGVNAITLIPPDQENWYHEVISSVVRSYFTKCCNEYLEDHPKFEGNIILALPDIDKLVKERHEELLKEQKSAVLSILKRMAAKLFEVTHPDKMVTFWTEDRILKDWGINIRPWMRNTSKNAGKGGKANTKEAASKAPLVAQAMYEYQSNDAEGRTIESILDKLTEAYLRYGKHASRIVAVFENNVKILKLWEEKGFIDDKDNTAVVIGEQNFIRDFLYGGASQKLKTVPPAPPFGLGISKGGKETIVKIDKDYQNKINKLFTAIEKNTEAYGSFSPVAAPDEFSYMKGFKEAVIGKLPIFRGNVRNPNILEANLSNQKLYWPLMQGVVHMEEASQFSQKDTTGDSDEVVRKQMQERYADLYAVVAEAMSHEDMTYTQVSELIKDLYRNDAGKALKAAQITSVANLATALIFMKVPKWEDRFYYMLRTKRGGATQEGLAHLELFDQFRLAPVALNLVTLPMFHISDTFHILGSPCFLLLKQPGVVGKTLTEKDKAISTFLSGFYMIKTFKHTIDPTGAYSTFEIIRNIQHGIVSTKDVGGEALPPAGTKEAPAEPGKTPQGKPAPIPVGK